MIVLKIYSMVLLSIMIVFSLVGSLKSGKDGVYNIISVFLITPILLNIIFGS